jgi:hypothetical protein
MPALRDYEGRLIRLTEERWAHIAEHPEMTEMRPGVEETLESPDVVVQSLSDPEARLYYRFYARTLVGGKHLCVVVKLRGDDAFVVTAYFTDQVKRGTVLWQRK